MRTASKEYLGGIRSAWAVVGVLSVGLGLFSYRYLVGVGPLGPEILANLFCCPFLYLHIAGAATALLVGAFQFLPGLRGGSMHRWLGRIYVFGCLLAASAGFVLAFGTFAGPIATLGFGSLSVIWFATNLFGWRTARLRRIDEHRAWMARSWSLTLAAVTLRLYLPLFSILNIPFIDGYRATSFISWIPNLIVAELWLQHRARRNATTEQRRPPVFGKQHQARIS